MQPDQTLSSQRPQVKEYTGLITQASTEAPTIIILKNTYQGTMLPIYTAPGQYTIQNNQDEFTLEKTTIEIGGIITNSYPSDTLTDEVYIETFNLAGTNTNGQLYKTYLSIKTYQ